MGRGRERGGRGGGEGRERRERVGEEREEREGRRGRERKKICVQKFVMVVGWLVGFVFW